MIRRIVLTLAIVFVACGGTMSSKLVAPPPKTSSTIDLGGGASGYLATPKGSGKRGVVIVIQEWWGLNDWIRANIECFASNGYVALAIDLYRGAAANNADEVHELMRGFLEDRALKDLHAAFDYLSKREDVDSTKIVAIGWCMGGGYAL